MASISEFLKDLKKRLLDLLSRKPDTSQCDENLQYKEKKQTSNEMEVLTMNKRLCRLGISAKEQEKLLHELFSEGKTSNLVTIRIEILNQIVDAQVKLSLSKKRNKELELKIHFVRNDLANDLNNPFMGHHFTGPQKQNLLTNKNAGEVIQIKSDGKLEDVLISVDRLTGELVTKSVKDIVIPDKYMGIELSENSKEKLRYGLPVIIENQAEGLISYNVTIQYSADSEQLEALSNTEKIRICDSSLSQEDVEDLKQGKTIHISNLINATGEKYAIYVNNDKQGKIVITPTLTLKYDIQIYQKNKEQKVEKKKNNTQGNSAIKNSNTRKKERKV